MHYLKEVLPRIFLLIDRKLLEDDMPSRKSKDHLIGPDVSILKIKKKQTLLSSNVYYGERRDRR
jgi:hypothetical protein